MSQDGVRSTNSVHNEVVDIEEPVVAATRVIDELFPECHAAFLSRGVLTSRRTAPVELRYFSLQLSHGRES